MNNSLCMLHLELFEGSGFWPLPERVGKWVYPVRLCWRFFFTFVWCAKILKVTLFFLKMSQRCVTFAIKTLLWEGLCWAYWVRDCSTFTFQLRKRCWLCSFIAFSPSTTQMWCLWMWFPTCLYKGVSFLLSGLSFFQKSVKLNVSI